MSASRDLAFYKMYNTEQLSLREIATITNVLSLNEVDADMCNYLDLILKVIEDYENLLSYVNYYEI